MNEIVQIDGDLSETDFILMADAQTSGGMLISVPAARAEKLIDSLVINKTLYSNVVGRVVEGVPGTVHLTH